MFSFLLYALFNIVLSNILFHKVSLEVIGTHLKDLIVPIEIIYEILENRYA